MQAEPLGFAWVPGFPEIHNMSQAAENQSPSLTLVFDGSTVPGGAPHRSSLWLDPGRGDLVIRDRWLGGWNRERRFATAGLDRVRVCRGFVMGSRPCWLELCYSDGRRRPLWRVGIREEVAVQLAGKLAQAAGCATGPVEEESATPDASWSLAGRAAYVAFWNAVGLGAGFLAWRILAEDWARSASRARVQLLFVVGFLGVVAVVAVLGSWIPTVRSLRSRRK
jgi:hypothetical protein